jgi:2-polyprenyl-6-methoxyphenol hydroxylase-like FAD-dependent oxidoreductase
MPGLGPRLRRARRAGPVRALGPLAYRVRPPRRAGVLLVGDALGFLDPFTGEGLHTALRSAELAAEVAHGALRAGDVTARALAPAHRRRRTELAGKGRLAALLQVVIGCRPLADFVARRLRARPAVLGQLMGVLGDFVPARELWRVR